MFSKFKLNIIGDFFSEYYDIGKKTMEENHEKLTNDLCNYIDYDAGIIDGDKLEKEWFNEIKADVFISHSHKDENLAIAIAGYLKKKFDLNSFVDSCVWGYADDILNQVNNNYNLVKKDSNGSMTYDHKKANYAASHIYLMLNSALNNMINKTECFMFISTGNATIVMDKNKATESTLSPWIYSEVVMANSMKLTKPKRYIEKTLFASELNEDMKMAHKLDFSDFVDIEVTDFIRWENKLNNTEHPLDTLYRILNQKKVCHKDN